METRPPFLHHHRYVPPPSENPNFYNPHHHNRLLPLPPQPQPPIQPLPPPPPQLPYQLSQHRPPLPSPTLTPASSQFSYRPHQYPIQDRPVPSPAPPAGQYSLGFIPHHILKRPRHLSPHRDSPHQRLYRSSPFYEENSSFVDRWADLPPPPPSRVPTKPPFHKQQRRPLSPILPPRVDNYINDYERNFRFRDEAFRDHGNRENPLWSGRKDREFDVPDYVVDDKFRYNSVRDGFGRNSSSGCERDVHRMKRDIATPDSQVIDMVLSPPKDFALNMRSYDSYDRNQELRWGYSRLGNDNGNGYIDVDGVSLSPHGVRREMVDSSYTDVDRLNSKMVGHGAQEFFDSSPRKKQVQKKSALLRIQAGKTNNKNNYRNRIHDNGRYSRAYYDEANLSVSGSFRGKEKDVFVDDDVEMDGQREKSPVELDVSFKSNALVAKAIKAPSSSVTVLESSLTAGNRKVKKVSFTDSSGTKLNEDAVKASGSNCPLSSSDKYDEELNEKIVSFEIDNSSGGLDRQSGFCKLKKNSEEKVINGGTDSYAPRNYLLAVSDKDLGQLAEEISAADNGANFMDVITGGTDSVKSVDCNQGVKCAVPDGVLLQRARKRKSVPTSLQRDASMQSVDVNCELSDPDISSTDRLPATSQPEEGVTYLRDRISLSSIDTTIGVVPSSRANELSIEKVNSASEGVVSVSKEDGISICSSLPFSLECSALKSVSSNPGDTAPYGGPDHVDKLIDNELSMLSSDRGPVESQNISEVLLESKNTTATFQNHNIYDRSNHPFLNESLVAESSLVREDRISVDGNAGLSSLKENKIHECHMDTSTSNHDALHTSNFDQRSGKCPGNIITVVDVSSANACLKEFQQNLVSIVSNENDINIGSPDANPSVGTGCEGAAGNQDLSNNSSACCTTDIATDTTLTDVGFLDHISKQSVVDGEMTLPGNVSFKRSPTSLFFNSAIVGRKRKSTDVQLDMHVVKANKIAGSLVSSADDQVESIILQPKNLFSVDEDIVNEDKDKGNTSIRHCFEEGFSVWNDHVKGGESGEEFSSILTSHVLSEDNPAANGATTSSLSAEPSSSIEKARTQNAYGVNDSCQDETTFIGLSSYSETSVILLQGNSVAGESCDGGTREHTSKLGNENSYQPTEEVDVKDNTTPMVFSPSDLQFNNFLNSEGCQGNLVGPDTNQKQSIAKTDDVNCLLLMENLADSSDNVTSCATSSTDKLIDSIPDTLSNMGSPEAVMSNFSSDMFNNESKVNRVSNSRQGKDNMSNNNPILAILETSFSLKTSLHSSRVGRKSGDTIFPDLALNSRGASSSNKLNPYAIKTIPHQMSTKYPSAAKSRTWHRTLNASSSVVEPKSQEDSVHTQVNSKKDVYKVQSYVRRGNSLVRKLPPVGAMPQVLPSGSSVYRLSSDNNNNGRNFRGFDADSVKPPASVTLGGSNGCPERVKTPPITGNIKSLSCTGSNLDLTYLALVDPPTNGSPGETNGPSESAEDMKTKRSSEEDQKSSKADGCETGSSNYLDCRSTGGDGNSGKKVLYLKRKSNQLIAASNCYDVSLCNAEKTLVVPSDAYFKRRKNQLIRTSLNESDKQGAVVLDRSVSSQEQDFQSNIQIRSSSKRPSGSMKRKFSLVWTLHGTLSSRKDGSSGGWHRMRPFLFPWKRASCWMNYLNCASSFRNDSRAIGQKLLLLRKREAIYKRSVNGFSLRRSKVLGVGGRNLKWSKSIEKNSRKANREATLAVAAAEKRKKAQNLASFTLFKSRNYVSRKSGHSIDLHPGERIFRIGSERYKMDATRRTLQRISGSDEQNSTSDDQSEEKKRKSYVPRRLLIGNDEYVRIGNGNKLVRDPKRRTRILANEKIRWSLHTTRLRLARKKKYCQFFTRFGKCNKDDKKCPYIHDPSKIAVCTKFLNGSCSNPSCKLTHKIIPERMQDCSYFLQGLCSNKNCPYRHVNVNPKSPVCEGFLRGYCADGNECQKKHTHVCPVFEANGSCPQGRGCKLHHPKKTRKGMKWKTSNLQKKAQGRYFGPGHVAVSDCGTKVCETITGKGDNSILDEEKFGEYISLDVRIGENEIAFEGRSEVNSGWEVPSEVEIAEVEELTRPIRIMNETSTIDSSPELDSSSEMITIQG